MTSRLMRLSSPLTFSILGLLSWGLQLRVWVATCVTALAGFCHRAFTPAKHSLLNFSSLSGTELVVLSVIFFATLALYNLDGTIDCPRNCQRRSRRRKAHIGLTLSSLIALTFLLPQLPFAALVLTLGGLTLSGLYAGSQLGNKAGQPNHQFKGIKRLPGVKGPFVGAAVAVAVVWVPLLSSSSPVQWVNSFLLTLVVGLYCTANALLFDLPDTGQDIENNVPTLALTLGFHATKRVCALLCLTALAILTITYSQRLLGVTPYAPNVLSLPQGAQLGLSALGAALFCASLLINRKTTRTQVAGWVDGALLLPILVQSIALY